MLWVYNFFYKIYFPSGGCPYRPLFLASFLILFSFSSFAQTKNYISKVWVADNGNGTYKNPVLHADYSDPDAIRVGDDYYLVSSSFEDIPEKKI